MKRRSPPLSAAQQKKLFDVLIPMGCFDFEKFSKGDLFLLYELLVSTPNCDRANAELIGSRLHQALALLTALASDQTNATISKSEFLISIVQSLQMVVQSLAVTPTVGTTK